MTDPVLEVTGLSKRFGTTAAVDDLSIDVHAGTIFGLLGPNGAGKTTTIRIICGELAPDSGHILLHGRPIHARVEDRVRVGLCPQELVIWERLTCREQLEFAGQMYGLSHQTARARAARLLAALDLDAKARALGGTLSGGMKRRLNIALALVHDPELVILDEAGAGLDPQSRVLVRDFIRSLAHDRTVLLTTHDMDEAERICDRVAIIDHGRRLACGSIPELQRGTAPVGGPAPTGDPAASATSLIELRFGRPVESQAAAALAAVSDLDIEQSPGLLTIRTADPTTLLPDLLNGLRLADLPPSEARLRAPSLEDVFLNLTGRTVRS